MSRTPTTEAAGLAEYIDAAPSPYHACREAARRLEAAGFRELAEVDAWDAAPGRYFVVRGGSLVAWIHADGDAPARGFRILGAHTDSPNLRVKPRPDVVAEGYRQLGVEVYGGVLLNSWLDRDLGLSGRALVRSADGVEARLFKLDRPFLRVAQLAIHLDREVNRKGLVLNPQRHMVPIWGLASESERGFRQLLADELDADADDVLSWDAMCHDLTPSRLAGASEEFLYAPRLDNLSSCYCGVRALVEGADAEHAHSPVVCLFDHEEVGSGSRGGAESPLLATLLERVVLTRGGSREDYHRALADSVCASADMAHAIHPNYVDRYEPDHRVRLNAGPVIKINANQRYASEGETEAVFQLACEEADVPYQKYVNRTDLACGSTIGPLTAARLGIRTVDVGCAQLSMQSAREMAGSHDPELMVRALGRFFG